jgi:uncharacterized protein (DUF433 family)
MELGQILSRDPDVMHEALVFAGTRVPLEILVEHLAAGDPLNEFLDDYPSVTREQAVGFFQLTMRETERALAA